MVGEVLKKAREGKGLTLEKVSADLKIRVTQLKAIEGEKFDTFPADVYTMGYIRAYSLYLGLDPQPLIEEFKNIMLKSFNTPEIEDTKSISKSEKKDKTSISLKFNPGVLVIITVLVISSITLFSIFKTSGPSKSLSRPVKEEGKKLKDIQKKEIGLPISLPPEKTKTSPSSNEDTQKLTPTKADRLTVTSPPKSVTPENEQSLKIIATELTWLLVETDEGAHDITLKPGEVVQFSSKKGFKLTIGNAGGIKLVLNEKELGSPGKSGEVIKGLKLPY